MLVQLSSAYPKVNERRQWPGTTAGLAWTASLLVAAACGGRGEQVAPLGADDSGAAAEGGSAGAVARGGQATEGGSAAVSTKRRHCASSCWSIAPGNQPRQRPLPRPEPSGGRW